MMAGSKASSGLGLWVRRTEDGSREGAKFGPQVQL